MKRLFTILAIFHSFSIILLKENTKFFHNLNKIYINDGQYIFNYFFTYFF